MGAINVKHTGAGADIALSSDGTSLLLDGTAIGGGGGGADLYAANESSPSAQPSATGTNSIAIGNMAVSTASDSFAGPRSRASGTNSFAVAGNVNNSSYGAQGVSSISLGYQSKATVAYSLAQGYGALATNASAIALGRQAEASGLFSICIGNQSTSSHQDAIVIGDSVESTAANQVSLGGTTDTVRISESYTLPTADGTTGQVLTTDGSGAVTFATAGGGGTALELYAENPSSPTAPSATGTNAVAIGSGAKAHSTNAIGLGNNSWARSEKTFAVFGDAQPSSIAAVAIGLGTVSSGAAALALGRDSFALAASAISLGKGRASGADSFGAAITNNSASYGASGANSVAIGSLSKASNTSAVCISKSSTASGANSGVFGGSSGTASGGAAIVIGGSSNTASGGKSTAKGYYGNTNGITLKHATGGGPNKQGAYYVLSYSTTDATPIALNTDSWTPNATNQVILPNNSAFAFSGTIVARQQASAGTASAAWKVEGLIRREGTAGTTVLVNSATTVLDNTPAWGMALTADTTNGGLAITVTGAASTNIRFVATINTSEVTY